MSNTNRLRRVMWMIGTFAILFSANTGKLTIGNAGTIVNCRFVEVPEINRV